MLRYFVLNYRQTQYLESVLEEAKNFDPKLVSFELHDDGSPKQIQDEVAEIVSRYPGVQAVFHGSNCGVIKMLETCLRASHSNYTYIGGGDDAPCPSAIQNTLLCCQSGEGTPVMVSDFYIVHAEKRASVYVEAILPTQWMTGDKVPPKELKKSLKQKGEAAYIATHACLAPTKALLSAGGFSERMRWHCDWFSFHVAALRNGIQYFPTPLACWRQSPAGYSHSSRSGSKQQRDVLREILSTLKKPEYSDVRETILCPNMTPMMDDIARQTLLAILSKSKYWGFLRWGHFRNALQEIAASWISQARWGGKILEWLDESILARPLQFLRQPLIRVLLRLGGARVGRKVYFGRKIKIRDPRGLNVGDHVTIGDGVSICAGHPLHIGSGVGIGDNVRLESVNFSKESAVRFLRKKSVTIGEDVIIGEDCTIGPGAHIPSCERVSPRMCVENVESTPLFFLDDTDQIRLDHKVLREWYGLDPKGAFSGAMRRR